MMRKTNFLSLLKTLVVRGGIQILMLVIVIGAVFTTKSETQLYSEQSFTNDTPTIMPQQEPTITNTREVLPSSTPTPTTIEIVDSTQTEKPSLTASITNTPTKKTTATIQHSPTDVVCGPPPGWVQYTVQSGDNLYRISLKFRTSVATLKSANCMGNSTVIVTGERLWVPDVATSTPIATYTPTKGATKSVQETATRALTDTFEPTLSPTIEITQTETTP